MVLDEKHRGVVEEILLLLSEYSEIEDDELKALAHEVKILILSKDTRSSGLA